VKTITVDDDQRVRLPDVEPRTKLSYEVDANGVIHLAKLVPNEPKPVRARLIERNGRLVGTTDRPVSERAIKELLADFP